MEVPHDYNSNDSFYQSKLLQSIGVNTNSDLILNEQYDNITPPANAYKSKDYMDEQFSDEEVLDYMQNDVKNYINTSKRIKEEEIEESLEELTNKQHFLASKNTSKKSSMINTESSNIISRMQSTVNKENQ